MATARRHHYVPQCYLKGFAVARRKKGFQTTVFDARHRKTYPTNIINVAVELDFNRIELEGRPPDALEKALARFEGELEPALERVILAGNLKDRDDRAIILNFMCLLALRNPRFRENIRDFHERVGKAIMGLMLATPERWASQIRKAKQAGYVGDTEVSYEEAKRFTAEGQYRIEVPSTYHIALELGAFEKVLGTFFARKWAVLRAGPNSGGFVTCDHPLSLMWSEPQSRAGLIPPGHGVRGTEVLFPVSTTLALVGAFEIDEGVHDLPDAAVAYVNGATISNAEWHVYARDGHFRFVGGIGEGVRKANNLLDDRIFQRPYRGDDE